jgi:aminoglycoside 3-N-acetyltransferase
MTEVEAAELGRAVALAAGVSPGGVVIVHSAFRILSHAGIRAEDFIEGLLLHLEGGTLLMPAMTWRTVTPDNPVFDEMATPSHVGVLSEVFRTRFASHRSIHPTHSTAALGPFAETMTCRHQEGETPCPPHSPFGQLPHVDAQILLLGVGFESCTMIHCAEEAAAPDIYLHPAASALTYSCRDRHGVIHAVKARRHLRLNRDFPKFAPMLAARGQLRRGVAAGAPWLACRAVDLMAVLTEAFAVSPYATLAEPKKNDT